MRWDFCIRKGDRSTFRREIQFSLPQVQGFMVRQALCDCRLGMYVETSRSDLLHLPPSIGPYKSVLKAIFKNFRLRPLNVPWLHHSGVHQW